MKIYLVGGAVRDKLLGLEVKELDWVVVGSNPQQMLALGYKQVGRDFPVFLHPDTKQEYALARQERKINAGYHGFSCNYANTITLEEDLLRRDLTINAMAMTADGTIIDPYGGLKDLHSKVLRHVSPAFVEDPLRLLRIARFAARYYHLGFTIAPETIKLMRAIVTSGELEYLIKERVWSEWKKSLLETNPEIFFCVLRECGALHILFPEIDCLFGVPATTRYHPEVDTGVHTLMVLRQAALISTKLNIRFAAVLHDLGKAAVAKNLWPSHARHADFGCEIIEKLCLRYKVPTKLRKFAVLSSKLHVQIHKILDLPIAEILATMEQADAFRNPEVLEDLLLVAKADSLGRGLSGNYPDIPWFFPGLDTSEPLNIKYKQEQIWQKILTHCKQIKISNHIEDGFSNEQIKKQLLKKRLECIKNTIESWNSHEK